MKKTNSRVEEFIRVDHAGERGAVKIYEGQLLALNTLVKDENLKKKILSYETINTSDSSQSTDVSSLWMNSLGLQEDDLKDSSVNFNKALRIKEEYAPFLLPNERMIACFFCKRVILMECVPVVLIVGAAIVALLVAAAAGVIMHGIIAGGATVNASAFACLCVCL